MTDDNNRIPVLWFDRRGNGPDELALELHPFPSDLGGKIPAYLGIRVRAGDIVIGAAPLVDGGFNLHGDQVLQLHQKLGAWLAANPAPVPAVEEGSAKWRAVAVAGTDITRHVAVMFDALIGSLDWGSGFLDDEEVESIVAVADLVGFDIPRDLDEKRLTRWRAQIAAKAAAQRADDQGEPGRLNPADTGATDGRLPPFPLDGRDTK